MITMNEYFGGKVRSLGLITTEGRATIGVITPGEYEFGTSTNEKMTITSGELQVRLPEAKDWEIYEQGSSFNVPSGKKFSVKADADVSYLCLYT